MPGNDGTSTVVNDSVGVLINPATYAAPASNTCGTAVQRIIQQTPWPDNSVSGVYKFWTHCNSYGNTGDYTTDLDDWSNVTMTTTTAKITWNNIAWQRDYYRAITQLQGAWKLNGVVWGTEQPAHSMPPQVADPGPPDQIDDVNDAVEGALWEARRPLPRGAQILIPTPRVNADPITPTTVGLEADSIWGKVPRPD